MKYAILALGLLVTPAAAETYTKEDCEFIEVRLNNCAEGPQEDPSGGPPYCEDIKTGGHARSLRAFWDRHKALVGRCAKSPRAELDCKSERVFSKLCDKVCHHEMTVQDALHKYCPVQRPRP